MSLEEQADLALDSLILPSCRACAKHICRHPDRAYKMLGDPAYGCKKDFFVSYYCGRNEPFQGRAGAEAG